MTRRPTVLVVDDDDDVRLFLRIALEGSGYDVLEATNGQEALDAVAADGLACVLLDLRMPGVDGWSVLERMAGDGHLAELPVVVHSAHADDTTARAVLAAGASAFLPKPFSVARLLGAVTEVVGVV